MATVRRASVSGDFSPSNGSKTTMARRMIVWPTEDVVYKAVRGNDAYADIYVKFKWALRPGAPVVIVINDRHLDRILKSYFRYYHRRELISL